MSLKVLELKNNSQDSSAKTPNERRDIFDLVEVMLRPPQPASRERTPSSSKLALVLLASLALLTATARAQSPNQELPSGDAKDKTASACLTCHEARIIVQQRLSKAAWTKELDKMTKWGAEVDPKDRDAVIEYLSANFGPDQPPYQAPRTGLESKPKSKTKQ